MAKKRERLDVIKDILRAVRDAAQPVGSTRLLYKSNLSPQMHKEYLKELLQTGLLIEKQNYKGKKTYLLTQKGYIFLEKYDRFNNFINELGL